MRHFTSILYIQSGITGGEFVFLDVKKDNTSSSYSLVENIIKTTERRLILFTSDVQNLHGVMPLVKGYRYSMSMWFTYFSNASENQRMKYKYALASWNKYLVDYKR